MVASVRAETARGRRAWSSGSFGELATWSRACGVSGDLLYWFYRFAFSNEMRAWPSLFGWLRLGQRVEEICFRLGEVSCVHLGCAKGRAHPMLIFRLFHGETLFDFLAAKSMQMLCGVR